MPIGRAAGGAPEGRLARHLGRTGRAALRGSLPDRYDEAALRRRWTSRVEKALTPGVAVLDVGSGARPSILPEDRPPGCRYVGMDVAAEELDRAPAGAYDDTVVADITRPDPRLVGQFDLVVSVWVIEHVPDTAAALRTMRSYLRPGGRLLAVFSGRYAPFALANRLLPTGMKHRLIRRIQGREPDDVFPARYDRCSSSALRGLLGDWADADIEPLFMGAGYLTPWPPLLAAYLVYEEWAALRGHDDLASVYLVDAIS